MYSANADLDADSAAAYPAQFDAVDLLAGHRAELLNVITGEHTTPMFDVAQMYECKGRDEFAPLPAPCRTSFGDFVVTVQLRIPRWTPEWDVVNGVAEQVRAAKAAADQQVRAAKAAADQQVLLDRRVALAAELAQLDEQLGQA